jgi:curli production assembly/transport component CsgG
VDIIGSIGSGLKLAAAGLLVSLAAGCASNLPLGEQASLYAGAYNPVVTPQTPLNHQLRAYPPPQRQVIVAVYDFPDLTGQYKDQENFQSLSRAVTQGGAAMLITALQDAGERRWFTVLDRASLNNLLKERQIVTEMRRVYRGEVDINESVLPPIANASILLEGGIIGYDTNTLTGGAGASFLGIGANAKYTQDTITVTLRAVSIKTSEVLASVTVNKVIASVALGGNVFRYVMMDRLLQAEAGITHNEPKQIALQAAVEKAVMSLILEGVQLKIWSFADSSAGAGLLAQYLSEKYGDDLGPYSMSPGLPVTHNAAIAIQTRPLPASARTPPQPPATVQTFPTPSGGQPSTAGIPAGPLPPAQGADGEPLN